MLNVVSFGQKLKLFPHILRLGQFQTQILSVLCSCPITELYFAATVLHTAVFSAIFYGSRYFNYLLFLSKVDAEENATKHPLLSRPTHILMVDTYS